jgi:sigma-B regulation protein RsbU (phosphoserine phosphatase)
METSAAKKQSSEERLMSATERSYLFSELERRRERLRSAVSLPDADASLSSLLAEVDAALERMAAGVYGICETCHEPVEADRLFANPLVRFCIDHLTRDEQRALESDLALAARIQQGLLPPGHFAAAGWEARYHYAPAGMVSGDYCDFLESNGDLLFLLGDVSGKGVAASMLMSHLHATFRSLASSALPLDQLVEAANRIFSESTLAGQFATLVVGRASQDGLVEFVSAGHVPLIHVGGAETRLEGATGVPLGMFSNTRFAIRCLSLAPEESLLAYTDGLTEARNPDGEEYGAKRICALVGSRRSLRPEALISACLGDLRHFTASAKQTDDLTLLVIQRTA